jgi:hypothetical protein
LIQHTIQEANEVIRVWDEWLHFYLNNKMPYSTAMLTFSWLLCLMELLPPPPIYPP